MRLFILLYILTISIGVNAQQCIQGNCKSGYGVLRMADKEAAVYRVGNFTNGKLEGDCMEISFHVTGGIGFNGKQYNEADFLLLTAYGQPGLKDVLALKPQVVKTGRFVNGELNGKGILYAVEMKTVPEFLWIVDFGKRFSNTWEWKELRYEGEFVNTQPSGRGQVTVKMPKGKITTTGENLTSADNPDVIFELEAEGLGGKGLFRGPFKRGFAHGWALTNMVNNKLTEGGKLVRQAWHCNWPGYATKADAYPNDEAGSQEFTTDAFSHYIAARDAQGKPTGFGRLTKTLQSGKVAYTYTGYFADGKPMGPGFWETPEGAWKAGLFNGADTLLKGQSAFFDGLYYKVYSGIDFFADGRLRNGNGDYTAYNTLADYARNNAFYEKYSGSWWQGYYSGSGTYWSKNAVSRGSWSYNRLVTGNATSNTSQLQENMVVVMNGIASPVKRDTKAYQWITLDNRVVPNGTVTLSKLSISSFYGACSVCSGSGKELEAHYIPPSTIVTDIKTVTTYKDASYVGGYWKNTSKVITEQAVGGYTQYISKTCSHCYGGRNLLNIKSLPEPGL